MRGRGWVNALLICGAVGATPASASTPASGRVDDPHQVVHWSGAVEGVGVAEACASIPGCDEFRVEVALPARTFANRRGGLQVGIRWPDERQDVDLYVYGPDGKLAAKAAHIVSMAESVLIQTPANGTYRAVVVPTGAEATRYEGYAEVEFAPQVSPLRSLLPDLVPHRPSNLHIATDAYLFQLGAPSMPGGCYPEETLEQGARRCLRFDQAIANHGDGPFELRYRLDGLLTDPNLNQRIYRSDGSFWERKADTYEFHPTHAHFHYKNFAQAKLWRADADGRRIGRAPVRTGRKNGFCMEDVENYAFGEKGDAARTYTPPECVTPSYINLAGREASMVNGISVGWADVYNWFLADQFIEISGLDDGYYVLESVADPADTVVEIDDSNNTASSLIRLCGDTAEVVGSEHNCSR